MYYPNDKCRKWCVECSTWLYDWQQDANKMPTRCQQDANKMTTRWQQDANKMTTRWQQDANKMTTRCQHCNSEY